MSCGLFIVLSNSYVYHTIRASGVLHHAYCRADRLDADVAAALTQCVASAFSLFIHRLAKSWRNGFWHEWYYLLRVTTHEIPRQVFACVCFMMAFIYRTIFSNYTCGHERSTRVPCVVPSNIHTNMHTKLAHNIYL